MNGNGEIAFVETYEEEDEGVLERSATIGDVIEAIADPNFCFGRTDMELIKEETDVEEVDDDEEATFDPCPSPPMYLATGLGLEFTHPAHLSPNFEDKEVTEEYYRKLVEQFPTEPLLLKNYAELLKSKGDFQGAEDYYLRATVADPEDGEILSQYAKFVWEVHHDKERAGDYFDRAARASPQDSNVLAALASFLWDTDDSQTQDSAQENNEDKLGEDSVLHCGDESHMSMGENNVVPSTEEYYKQLVEQYPSNAVVLKDYAYFLYKSKGDLEGAEAYYSRAILVDPNDGEILSQYANLVWELYQDEGKARSYFERSVQAAPADCDVLAAYARFLWATCEEDEGGEEDNEAVELPSVETQVR